VGVNLFGDTLTYKLAKLWSTTKKTKNSSVTYKRGNKNLISYVRLCHDEKNERRKIKNLKI
jgi:hypothetical protein